MNSLKTSALPKIALLCAVFFWGSSFIAMKYAVQGFDPGKIVFFRMLVAAVIFLFLYRFWGKIQYQRNDWIYLTIMAICEPGIYFFLESQALRLTTAGSAATINSLQPPIVAILAWLILKERPRYWTFIGFGLCIFGAVGLSLNSESTSYAPSPWLGNLFEFGAMAASGIYVILLKKLSSRYTPFFLTALQSLAGVMLFSPFLFMGESLSFDIPFRVVMAVIFLATFVTFGGYYLYNWGISKTSATEASIYLNLIPVIGVIIAFVILDEIPDMFQIIMMLIILFGVLICEFGSMIFLYLGNPTLRKVSVGDSQ